MAFAFNNVIIAYGLVVSWLVEAGTEVHAGLVPQIIKNMPACLTFSLSLIHIMINRELWKHCTGLGQEITAEPSLS